MVKECTGNLSQVTSSEIAWTRTLANKKYLYKFKINIAGTLGNTQSYHLVTNVVAYEKTK